MLDSGLISIGSHTYDMHQWPPFEEVRPARENMLPLSGESETDYIHAVQTDAAREAETFAAFGIPAPDVIAFPEGAHADLTDVVLRECGYKVTLTTDESRVNTVVVGLPQTLIDLGRMTVLPGMTDRAAPAVSERAGKLENKAFSRARRACARRVLLHFREENPYSVVEKSGSRWYNKKKRLL